MSIDDDVDLAMRQHEREVLAAAWAERSERVNEARRAARAAAAAAYQASWGWRLRRELDVTRARTAAMLAAARRVAP